MRQNSMFCQEYLEVLWNEDSGFTDLIDSQYWEGGCNTEQLFDYMRKSAQLEGIDLVDADEWDYDKPLYECYKNSEKGLS